MFPKIHFMLLVDIGPIFKILKKCVDGSSSCFGARLFGKCQKFVFPNPHISKNNISPNVSGIFLDFFRCPGVSKDNECWFWGWWRFQKSRDHGNWSFELLE